MLASQRPHDFFELIGRVQILLFVSTGRIVTLFHVKKTSRFLQMKVSSGVCVCVCVCVCMYGVRIIMHRICQERFLMKGPGIRVHGSMPEPPFPGRKMF